MTSGKKTIALFDVDGTLTAPRQVIRPETMAYLMELKKRVTVALVGGSDLVKILEQMGGDNALHKFDFLFSENGLVAHKAGEPIGKMNILTHMGEEKLQTLINFALSYMARLQLPAKRGTFVEFRSGMLNLCPVGRSCSQAEREQFAKFDQEHRVREAFVQALREQFSESGLTFAIGGQISIDVFPDGWDKRYCLRYLEKDFDTIHFFGDKTAPGGNDHEIFEDPRTIGHTVKDPEDTVRQLSDIFPS